MSPSSYHSSPCWGLTNRRSRKKKSELDRQASLWKIKSPSTGFQGCDLMVFTYCVCVARSQLWSTCQQSCMMLRKYLMPNSSGKLILKHTHTPASYLWTLWDTLTEGDIRELSHQLKFPSWLCSVTPILLSPTHSIWVEPHLLYQVIKISSNWHRHKGKPLKTRSADPPHAPEWNDNFTNSIKQKPFEALLFYS